MIYNTYHVSRVSPSVQKQATTPRCGTHTCLEEVRAERCLEEHLSAMSRPLLSCVANASALQGKTCKHNAVTATHGDAMCFQHHPVTDLHITMSHSPNIMLSQLNMPHGDAM